MSPDRDGYDAASVLGQMAGLGADQPAPDPVTPGQLVERFCKNVPPGPVAGAGVDQADGHTVARGHCGYVGGRGDSLSVGFDDGYDFMGYLTDRGWRPLPSKGDWPYLVYLLWRRDDELALVEYCEADLTVWTFETADAIKAHYRTLKDCP